MSLDCPSGGPKAARRARHLEGVALVEQIVAPTGGLVKGGQKGQGREGTCGERLLTVTFGPCIKVAI